MTAYNAETWAEAWQRGEVRAGDKVTGDVVLDAMNALPPVSMGSECAQMGEPYGHSRYGFGDAYRELWLTWRLFSRSWAGPGIADLCGIWEEGATWEFCGACFAGETNNRIAAFEPTRVDVINGCDRVLTDAELANVRDTARIKAETVNGARFRFNTPVGLACELARVSGKLVVYVEGATTCA